MRVFFSVCVCVCVCVLGGEGCVVQNSNPPPVINKKRLELLRKRSHFPFFSPFLDFKVVIDQIFFGRGVVWYAPFLSSPEYASLSILGASEVSANLHTVIPVHLYWEGCLIICGYL